MKSVTNGNDFKEPNYMNSSFDKTSSSIGGRIPRTRRTVEFPEHHALVMLCSFTATGLFAIVAAVFTTVLTLPPDWRDCWLAICIAALGVWLAGIVLFFRSYKGNAAS
jgi:hypothetical protein